MLTTRLLLASLLVAFTSLVYGGSITWSKPEAGNGKVQVAEGSDAIYTVEAASVDSNNDTIPITYAFVGTSDTFDLDGSTGAITLKTGKHLDYEDTTNHTLQVKATDADGSPAVSTATVIIEVTDKNDNLPVFPETSQNVTICSKTTGGTVGTYPGTDADGTAPNNVITYSLTGDESGDDAKFSLNNETAVLARTSVPFDTEAEMVLVIRGVDNGTPPNTGTTTVIVTAISSESVCATGGATIAAMSATTTAMATVLLVLCANALHM